MLLGPLGSSTDGGHRQIATRRAQIVHAATREIDAETGTATFRYPRSRPLSADDGRCFAFNLLRAMPQRGSARGKIGRAARDDFRLDVPQAARCDRPAATALPRRATPLWSAG